jgi:hypothetical protein
MNRSGCKGLMLTLATVVLCGGPLSAADTEKKPPKELASFGTLHAPSADAVRTQAQDWLKAAGKSDEASLKAFEAIWQADKALLDKVADTLTLGDADAKKLLDEARDPNTPAPIEVPALLKDAKRPAFYRANLALAYGKTLSNRRVYEEALDALKAVKPEQVVDPAAYFFHKAVAEHSLMMKPEANDTIARLLDDVADAPERYRMVAALMSFDMMTWREKDLDWIARKMDNIQRRLDLARGGKQTQKIQKQVLARLDEMIKELENKKNGNASGNGGSCPNGGQPGNNPNNNTRATSPQNDSNGGNGSGPGTVDPKKLKELAEVWGKLPEKERAKAMLQLTRDMDPRYCEAIENYFKGLTSRSNTESGR